MDLDRSDPPEYAVEGMEFAFDSNSTHWQCSASFELGKHPRKAATSWRVKK